MPEKPEVITVAKTLERHILGKTIEKVDIYWDNIIEYPSLSEFKKRISRQIIKKISTRGKWIVMELSNDYLLVHLRMEGKFFYRGINDPRGKHEHVVITFTDGLQLRFHDTRKFGKFRLMNKEEWNKVPPLSLLGYEYNDKNLTKEYLYQALKSRKLPIKTVLLDQSIIAGIGNIYDDEILFLSHLSPLMSANKVSLDSCQEIIDNTKKVLDSAIALGGTTIRSYTSDEGVHGKFQQMLLVHGKENELCPVCGNTIIKIKVGGRGTYYCKKCQKDKINSKRERLK